MIKEIVLILLPFISQQFITFQLALWSGNVAREQSDGPCIFTHALPRNVPTSYQHLLSFTGLEFRHIDRFSFDAQVSNSTSTWIQITAEIFSTLKAFEIRYFVVILQDPCGWAQIEKQTIDLSNYTFSTAGTMRTKFNCSLSKALPNPPNSTYYIFHSMFQGVTVWGPDDIGMGFEAFAGFPTYLQMRVHLFSNTRYISFLRYSVLILDLFAMTNLNVIHASQIFYLANLDFSFFDSTLDQPPNYAALSPYKRNGGYEGSCFTNFERWFFANDQTIRFTVDINSEPFQIDYSITLHGLIYYYTLVRSNTVCLFQQQLSGTPCDIFGSSSCSICSRFQCLTCNTHMYLENSYCFCPEGDPLGTFCNIIPGCTLLIPQQAGGQLCVQCDGVDFHPTPVEGKCQCLNNGTIINGICNNITGCTSPQKIISGVIICHICNISQNFNLYPSSDGICYCQQYYQLSGQTCVEICGDGVLFSSNSSLCDDGNLADQDGCSSSCTVQDFYRCSSTDPLSPSSCTYQGINIDLTLSYAERNGEENKGTFAFTFYPRLFFLSKMNFTHNTLFSCASEYSVTSMSYSEGELTVEVDFTKDLEDVECSLSISYDQDLATVKNSSLNFTAVSRNEELILVSEEDISKRKTIKFIFTYLSLGFLGVFLFSLCHKMIGAELAVPFQIVYLSFALYSQPSYLSPALRSFSLVTGYRTLFFSQEYENMLLPFSYRAEMSPQVLENHIVWCGVLLALLLLTGILKVYDYFTSAKGREEPHCRNSGRVRLLYDHLLFPLSVFSFLFTLLSSFVNSLRSIQVQGTFPKALNGLSWLLLLLPLGLVLSQIFKVEPQPQGNDKRSRQFKKGYIPLFLVRLLVLAVLLSLGITQTFSFLIYPIALLMLLYLVLIVLYRPYEGCFSNLSIILNECLALIAVCLALVNKFFRINSDIEAFILFTLQGLIILCLVFSLIRVFLYIRDLCRKEWKVQDGEDDKKEQPEAKKKSKLTDVDFCLDRAIREQKKNPYTSVLPPHSYPNQHKRYKHLPYKVEADRQEDPNFREIKDRLITSIRKKRGKM